MPRTSRASAVETTHSLRAWRKAKSLTLEQLADAIGMSHQNLGRIERGLVPLGEEHHGRLARALGITPADLFRDPGDASGGDVLVPIIGRVGADAEGTIIYTTADETDELVPIAPGGTEKAVALKVVGHSMGDWAPEGSLIYFESQKTPPTPDMLGYPCVVETEDGRVLLKRLLRGSRAGVYDLESRVGPTLQNVRLRWAAEVTAVIPPKQARRIIRRADEVRAA
jgi:transcriptional regulator with XRE-family HTH domain